VHPKLEEKTTRKRPSTARANRFRHENEETKESNEVPEVFEYCLTISEIRSYPKISSSMIAGPIGDHQKVYHDAKDKEGEALMLEELIGVDFH
jgi:hypothetical protein